MEPTTYAAPSALTRPTTFASRKTRNEAEGHVPQAGRKRRIVAAGTASRVPSDNHGKPQTDPDGNPVLLTVEVFEDLDDPYYVAYRYPDGTTHEEYRGRQYDDAEKVTKLGTVSPSGFRSGRYHTAADTVTPAADLT